jgi:predicted O-methyltransferase YrrM
VGAARDARRLATARPDVAAALERVHDDPELRAIYDRYVTHVSHWEWAISWPSVRVLDALCEAVRPGKMLDLGSGFSTYVLCNWARRSGVDCEVVSVDTSDEWLEKTRAFLTAEGLQARLIPARAIDSLPTASFDLAFDDLGRTEDRASVISTVVRVVAPGGVVLLDDMNARGYRSDVRSTLAAAHWDLYSARSHTIDAKGRFAMLTAAPTT